jgi:hypothetical protein
MLYARLTPPPTIETSLQGGPEMYAAKCDRHHRVGVRGHLVAVEAHIG